MDRIWCGGVYFTLCHLSWRCLVWNVSHRGGFSDRSLKYWFLINSGERCFYQPKSGNRSDNNFSPLCAESLSRTCQLNLTEGHSGGPAAPPAPGVSLLLFGPCQHLPSTPYLSDSTLSQAPSPRLCLDLLPILFLAFGGIFSSLLGLLLLTMEIYCVLCAWKMNFHVRRGEQLPQAREIKLGL